MAEKKNRPWIKLWRKSDEDKLYFKEPFDKWHAWQDLLILADEKGKLKTSVKRLRIRWNWKSDKRVRAYLGELKGEQKISLKGEPSGTVITIEKWALYQSDFSKKGEPQKGKKGEQKGKQEDTSYRSRKDEPSQGSAHLPSENNNINEFDLKKLNEELDDDW